MAARKRQAIVERNTKETRIRVVLDLDGSGRARLATGIPFFEHMLTLLVGHGLMNLEVKATGDLEVDQHHVVEDVGLALGQALVKAAGDKQGIVRYGWSSLAMDESLVQISLDLSGRPFLAYGLKLRQKRVGGFDTELAEEFFRGLVNAAGLTLHLQQAAGGNTHHLIEAAFKALGRALRQAVAVDPRQKGIPSTKGKL